MWITENCIQRNLKFLWWYKNNNVYCKELLSCLIYCAQEWKRVLPCIHPDGWERYKINILYYLIFPFFTLFVLGASHRSLGSRAAMWIYIQTCNTFCVCSTNIHFREIRKEAHFSIHLLIWWWKNNTKTVHEETVCFVGFHQLHFVILK